MPVGICAGRGTASRLDMVKGNALGSLAMLIWAAGFPASELLLETWDPIVLVWARFLSAVPPLLFLWWALDGMGAISHAYWSRGVFVGGAGLGLAAWLLILGQWMTDPVTVAIIASFSPLAGMLIEIAFDRRRPRPKTVVGMTVCIVGGMVATGAASENASLGLGVVAAAASVFLFAWASRASVSDFPGLSVTGRTALTLTGGLMVMTPVCLIAVATGGAEWPADPVGLREIGLLCIFGPGSMALTQLLWIASVGRLGIAIATFNVNLSPFYVMIFMMALGAEWNWTRAAGAGLVLAGAVIAQWSPRPGRQGSSAEGMIGKNTPPDRTPNQFSPSYASWSPTSTSR